MSYPCPTQPWMNHSRVYSGVINIECPPSQYVTLIQLTMLTGMMESQKPVGKLQKLNKNLSSQIFRFVSLNLFTYVITNKLTCDNMREQLRKLVIVVYVCQWLHEAWIWQAELCVHTTRRVYTVCMDCTRPVYPVHMVHQPGTVTECEHSQRHSEWWPLVTASRANTRPSPNAGTKLGQRRSCEAATLAQHCTGIGWTSRVGWEDPS